MPTNPSTTTPPTTMLPQTPDLPLAQDYQALRQKGLDMIEQLASSQWTDYNLSDPGITLLEQFCYAITDLSYRSHTSHLAALQNLEISAYSCAFCALPVERIDVQNVKLFIYRP